MPKANGEKMTNNERNRRSFLILGAASVASAPFLWGGQESRAGLDGAGVARSNVQGTGQDRAQDNAQGDSLGVQHLPKDQVFEFVRGAHTDLEGTKKLLTAEPRLLRATYEWAPGDFESAIGAAAHSGSVDIVEFLLSAGGSYSIFVAAVLGHVDTVKAFVTRSPELVNCQGPHGIPLLSHALAGGEQAADVADLLMEHGAEAEEAWDDLEIDAALAGFAVGKYQIARSGRTIAFEIVKEESQLFIVVMEREKKRLLYQGQNRFNIEGTPAELTFEQTEKNAPKCERVLLKEGFPVGFASRVSD